MKNNTIKYRKIRGINRRKRDIQAWGERHKELDIESLRTTHRDYVKFWVRPWSNLETVDSVNSVYPEPTGELETLLISNLLKIYESWQQSLQQLNEPYYLQLWLFEDSIRGSQIVCAIDDVKDFYNDTFEPLTAQPEQGIRSSIHYNSDTARFLDRYNWSLYRFTQAYDMSDPWDVEYVNSLDKRKLLRIQTIGQTEYQVVEIDKVWLIESVADR